MFDHASWQPEHAPATPAWNAPELAASAESVNQAIPPAPRTPSIVEELRNLGELYAAGALTDAEYVSAKVRLIT